MKYLSKLLVCLVLTVTATNCFSSDEDKVNDVLNTLHRAASEANWEEYFGVYRKDAIFIGTDASETWTIEQFKSYAKPAFESGRGWTYHSFNRHIYFSETGNVAWFDEMLENKSLGITRGTGVLEKIGSEWKVLQYHLAIPIPNELADSVATKIKKFNSSQSTK